MKVVDERTVAFPNHNGNGMCLSMSNAVENGMVGMLFMNWSKGHRLRLHGSARSTATTI